MRGSSLLPTERVAKIRAGTGPYDIARDLVDLVGLYREHAKGLRDKIPFTDAWFAEAEAVGTWLMANITPTAGSPAAEEEKPAEPVVAEPVTPGNSTPPAPMRPKSAQARETRATARRRR